MWKLTITQKCQVSYESNGKVETYNKETSVSYESDNINDLLILLGQLSLANATNETIYTIERVGEK